MTRTYPFGGDNQVGEGGTSVTGGTFCTGGVIAYISATYNDPDGEPASTVENSDGSATTRRYAPIGSAFTTIHKVDFSGSSVDCNANCEFSTTRTK